MEYLKLRFSEIMQYKIEKNEFTLNEFQIGKLSGQRGQGRVKSTGKTNLGLLEIKLQLKGT